MDESEHVWIVWLYFVPWVDWQVDVLNLSVRLCIRSFIHYQTYEHIILKQVNQFWCNLGEMVMGQGHETINFGSQEVKGRA